MKVEDTLRECLLNFPTIYANALSVYAHWFCVVGNGYEWVNGELVHPEYGDSDLRKHHTAKNVNEAIIQCLDWDLIHSWDKNGINKEFLHCFMDGEDELVKYIMKKNGRTIIYVKLIMDTENRMKDFSIPVDPVLGDKNKFSFYPICNYSAICNIPDDIKNDWLLAAMKMIEVMEEHKELVEDNENLLESSKKRIYDIYNGRHNKCEYLGDIYEIYKNF